MDTAEIPITAQNVATVKISNIQLGGGSISTFWVQNILPQKSSCIIFYAKMS